MVSFLRIELAIPPIDQGYGLIVMGTMTEENHSTESANFVNPPDFLIRHFFLYLTERYLCSIFPGHTFAIGII
jgi:hypothetical protein